MWTTPGFGPLVVMYFHSDGNIMHKGGEEQIPQPFHYDHKMVTPDSDKEVG
jgi:hypothetical protein